MQNMRARSTGPQKLVVVIVGNDFDESLTRYKRRAGFHFFEELPDGEFDLVRIDYSPSLLRRIGRRSALVRYLRLNGSYPKKTSATAAEYYGNTRGRFDEERLRLSERATSLFLDQLPTRAGLTPVDIVLVVDGLRQAIYRPELLPAAEASFFGHMRAFLLEKARQRGFAVARPTGRLRQRPRAPRRGLRVPDRRALERPCTRAGGRSGPGDAAHGDRDRNPALKEPRTGCRSIKGNSRPVSSL